MNERDITNFLEGLTPEQAQQFKKLMGGQSNGADEPKKSRRKQTRRRRNQDSDEIERRPRRGQESMGVFNRQGKVACSKESIQRGKNSNKFLSSQNFAADRQGFKKDSELDKKLSGGNAVSARPPRVKKIKAYCNRCDRGYRVYPHEVAFVEGEASFVCDRCVGRR